MTSRFRRGDFSFGSKTSSPGSLYGPGAVPTVIDLAGTIGRHVLAGLLPQRRLRVSPRIDRTSCKATTGIEILAPAGP